MVSAPRGSGPLSGACFAQSYSAKADIVAMSHENAARAGTLIQKGDKISTGSGGQALITLPDGTKMVVRKNSIIVFTFPDPGLVKAEVLKGGLRFVRTSGGVHGIEVKVRDKILRPQGTEVFVSNEEDAAAITVVDGSATITDETGSNTTLEAWQMELPGGNVSDYNLTADDGGLAFGLPLRSLPTDDFVPEPYASYKADFKGGVIPEDWIWQDTGNKTGLKDPRARDTS